MSLYYDNSGYFTLQSRFPMAMANLHRVIISTTYSPQFDDAKATLFTIKNRHMREVAEKVVGDCTISRDTSSYETVVQTEVFFCTPNDFWMAVESVASELDRLRNSIHLENKND